MNKEARMWGRIVYACLIQGKYMTEMTRDRVCLIYALMCADMEINVGSVIFSMMNKMRTQVGRSFGFGSLVTRFLRRHRVDEEELDYKPDVITRPMDITTVRSLMIMMSRIEGRPATLEELHAVELDYPPSHHARTLLRIGPDYVEPIDNDVPTDEEHKYRDSDMESNKEEESDDNAADNDGDDVDVAPEDMSAIVSFDHYDYDHTGYTDFATSRECSTCKCQDCKVKHDGVINTINALTASVKKMTSKRGVVPSKRISYPYTPLEIKVAKRRRKDISKTSSSIDKRKIAMPLSLSCTTVQCTGATREQNDLKKVDVTVEATAEEQNIAVHNPSAASKEEEKVEPINLGERKNYPFEGFNISDKAPKKLTKLTKTIQNGLPMGC
ncbi:hypothetical protein FXO38_32040 [Capsicum annuum]|nr:hypothetical protein FXO38_32040 [Capsicum annuum]